MKDSEQRCQSNELDISLQVKGCKFDGTGVYVDPLNCDPLVFTSFVNESPLFRNLSPEELKELAQRMVRRAKMADHFYE